MLCARGQWEGYVGVGWVLVSVVVCVLMTVFSFILINIAIFLHVQFLRMCLMIVFSVIVDREKLKTSFIYISLYMCAFSNCIFLYSGTFPSYTFP